MLEDVVDHCDKIQEEDFIKGFDDKIVEPIILTILIQTKAVSAKMKMTNVSNIFFHTYCFQYIFNMFSYIFIQITN